MRGGLITGLLSFVLSSVAVGASAAERVVFCEKGSGSCAQAQRMLGTSVRGSWALVDDRVVLAPGSKTDPIPRILYFTPGEYEDAIAGLSAKERELAVLRRLELMADGIPGHAFGLVHDDLMQVATAVRDLGNDDLGTVLDAAIVISGGANRFDNVRPVDALSDARKSLAQVLVELPAGPVATGYGKEATVLAEIDADGAHGRTLRRPPFAAPERAYFVPHMPAAPRSDPMFLDQPTYAWRGGVVRMLRPDEAAAPPWKDRKPRLVYFGRATFLRDIGSLTDAQIDRRLRARMTGVSLHELADLAVTLAFDHAVLVRQYTNPIRERQVPWLSRWNEAVALDGENLRRVLADAQPRAPDERKARIEKLRADVALAAFVLRGVAGTDPNDLRLAQIATSIARLSE
jgi:hypothetical protein